MKKHSKKVIYLIIFCIPLLSCKNEKLEQLELENIKLRKELYQIKIEQKKQKTKYVYAVFKISKPKVSKLSGFGIAKTKFYVDWDTYYYTTDIVKLQNFDSNSEYVFMDNALKKVKENLSYADMNFQADLTIKVSYVDEIEKLENNNSKILSSEFLSFDTYKEASINKNNNYE